MAHPPPCTSAKKKDVKICAIWCIFKPNLRTDVNKICGFFSCFISRGNDQVLLHAESKARTHWNQRSLGQFRLSFLCSLGRYKKKNQCFLVAWLIMKMAVWQLPVHDTWKWSPQEERTGRAVPVSTDTTPLRTVLEPYGMGSTGRSNRQQSWQACVEERWIAINSRVRKI